MTRGSEVYTVDGSSPAAYFAVCASALCLCPAIAMPVSVPVSSDRPRLEHWCNTFGRNITCNGCFGNYCRDPLGKKSKTDRTWKEPSAEVWAGGLQGLARRWGCIGAGVLCMGAGALCGPVFSGLRDLRGDTAQCRGQGVEYGPSLQVQAQQLSMIRNHAMKQRHMAGGATGARARAN